jgi:hypothetical protein
MKKIFLAAFCLMVLLFNSSVAQVFTGINLKYASPVRDYNEVDNGLGLYVSIGYSFNQKLEFNISAEKLWMNSIVENYNIDNATFKIKYIFLENTLKPYIEIGTGYFKKSYDLPFDNERTENGMGIIASIGVLTKTHIINGLYFNTKLSYYSVYTENQIYLMNLNIGLLYYFN